MMKANSSNKAVGKTVLKNKDKIDTYTPKTNGEVKGMDELKLSLVQNDKEGILEVLRKLPHIPDAVDSLRVQGIHFVLEVCKKGYPDVLQILLDQDVNIASKDFKESPVQVACRYNQPDVLELLLLRDAPFLPEDVQVWHEASPFYIASKCGHKAIVDVLYDKKLDHVKTEAIRNCLMYAACLGGNKDIIKMWFSPGMDVNLPLELVETLEDCEKKTALYAACLGGHRHVVEFLMANADNVELTDLVCNAFPDIIGDIVKQYFLPVNLHAQKTADNYDEDDDIFQLYTGHLQYRNLHMLHTSWLLPYSVTLVELDISDNKITELPACLPWGFQNLRIFTAIRNNIRCLAEPKDMWNQEELCPRLEEMNLSYNKLESVCSDIFYLASLQKLSLSHNNLKILVRTVHHKVCEQLSSDTVEKRQRNIDSRQSITAKPWLCTNLKDVDLSHNALQMLPLEIKCCTGLEKLNVKHNELTTFPQPWDCKLVNLDVSDNKLERFPVNTEIYWCSTLKFLNISNNCLDEINEGIVKLNVLTDLNAANNKIERLPIPEVWECNHLHHLNMKHNRLGLPRDNSPVKTKFNLPIKFAKKNRLSMTDESRLIQFPELLTSCLKELRLADNNLDCVPSSVCNLKLLEVLDLSHNPLLKTLPKELGKLRNCGMLKLKGLTLDNVSQEICEGHGNKTREVLSTLLENLRDAKPYNKVKTVVLGKKDKGKTTLVNLLAGRKQQTVFERKSIVKEQITISKRKSSFSILFEKQAEIVLRVWDIAGDECYNLIHHSVFTPHSLYLLVWDFWSIDKDMDKIAKWIYNIQASTPHFSVVLVGTFLDKMTLKQDDKDRRISDLQEKIDIKFYSLRQPPTLCAVSCVNNEGIDNLKNIIYKTVMNMKLPGRRGCSLIGRKIPKSYRLMETRVKEELERLTSANKPLCLTQTEVMEVVESLPVADNDLMTLDECTQLTKFLVETGSLLHFSDQLGALNTLYFLDPAWLCDVLVHILVSEEGKRLLKTGRGMIKKTDVERIYKEDETRFPKAFIHQYIELLERFEIAISITNSQKLFFPCQLPESLPMNDSMDNSLSIKKLRRLYRMAECPSGFWMRLLSRMITRVEQFSTEDWFHKPTMTQSIIRQRTMRQAQQHEWTRGNSYHGLHIKNPNKTFCREWLYVQHAEGSFCIEPVTFTADSESGSCLQTGVLITEVNMTEKFGIMGIIVDEIEDIIQDYYPGLLEPDQDTMQNRLERYALCSTCYQGNDIPGNVNHFTMEHCARMMVKSDFISCPQGVKHELTSLVPDLLMHELPSKFILNTQHLELEESQDSFLGGGVTGSVFKGKYKGDPIAMKVYRSDIRNKRGDGQFGHHIFNSNSSDSGTATMSTQGSVVDPYNDDGVYENFDHQRAKVDLDEAESIKALRALREMRQEVALTSRLQHPCIVALIGITFTPKLMMALELAPLGSLRSTLDVKMAERPVFNKYRHKDTVFPPLFNKELTFKFVYQIAKGLQYLHQNDIIYKDLKSDNILTMSLDPRAHVNVKLSDYGISKYCWGGRSVGLVGTPGYQAPEILDGLAYDEKVDVFAFAMVVYEIVSGRRPYEEYDNMAQISKAVKTEGKRPNVKEKFYSYVELDEILVEPYILELEFNVHSQFPYLEDLMMKCWHDNAASRPAAARSTKLMQNIQFLAQNSSFKMDDKTKFEANCVLGSSDDTSQSLLWIWEGCGPSRCCSILDMERSCFRLQKCEMPGPRVVCMSIIDRHVWVGNEAGKIEIFGTTTDGSLSGEKTVELDGVPVQIENVQLSQVQEEKLFCIYVSLANGQLLSYQSKQPTARSQPGHAVLARKPTVKKLSGFSEPQKINLRSDKIYCMTLANKKQELWVSNRGHLDIVNCRDFKVKVEERINLTILLRLCRIPVNPKYHVSQMISANGQVFCLINNSPIVFEFCDHSFCCKSVLNLGLNKVKNEIVSMELQFSQSDHEAYHGTSVAEDSPKKRTDSTGSEYDSSYEEVKMPEGQYNDVKGFWSSKREVNVPKEGDKTITQSSTSPTKEHFIKSSGGKSPALPPRQNRPPPRPTTSYFPRDGATLSPPAVPRRLPNSPNISSRQHQESISEEPADGKSEQTRSKGKFIPSVTRPSFTPDHFTFDNHSQRKTNLKSKASCSLPNMRFGDAFTQDDCEIVTSIDIVGKSLWVGRSYGDVCIVDTQRVAMATDGKYGKVVAVMKNLEGDGNDNVRLDSVHLLKSGNCETSVYRYESLTSNENDSKVEIASWDRYDAEDVTRVQNYWSVLVDIEKSLIHLGNV